jgi:iron complex transport system permease protein
MPGGVKVMNIFQSSFMGIDRRKFCVHFFKSKAWLAILFLVLIFVVILSLSLGSVAITPMQLVEIIKGNDKSSAAYRIFMYVRLPRTIAAVLAGSALATSGAMIQAVLNNALASPNIIGINSGAGFATMLCMVWFPSQTWLLPPAAFVGAFLTALAVSIIAMRINASKITIILTGVAIGSILTAGINTIKEFFPDVLIGSSSFMMGGLSYVTNESLRFAGVYILIGLSLSTLFCNEMNVLSLGEDSAHSLGMNVVVYRFILLMIAAVLAGAAVSFAGLLGFVGLIVPHCVRVFVGEDHKKVIVACIVAGAIFVAACDLLARLIFAPFELPVGIIMSFLGGPFFLWLLLTKRRHINA